MCPSPYFGKAVEVRAKLIPTKMISVTKSPLLYAVSQVIAGGARPSVTALATKSEKIVVLPQQIAKSSYSLSKLIPSGTERISVSLCGTYYKS